MFPSKVQNLTVFSIIYMIRIRHLGAAGIISEGVFDGKVSENCNFLFQKIQKHVKPFQRFHVLPQFDTVWKYFCCPPHCDLS